MNTPAAPRFPAAAALAVGLALWSAATAFAAEGPGAPGEPPAAPTNLLAAPTSASEIRLAWQDNAGDETGFRSEIRLDGVWVEIPIMLPPDTVKVVFTGLPAATELSFRVRATGIAGISRPSNVATVATFAADAGCVTDAETLCLSGGRFRVAVRYYNQHAGGGERSGVAVPATDETGQFWFFDPANTELIVKILDGRGLNGHFWVFYGALSNLEYWVTVTDTRTGAVEVYHNPPGEVCGLADTLAFAEEPPGERSPRGGAFRGDALDAAPAAAFDLASVILVSYETAAPRSPQASEVCIPGPETLCLLDRRLAVGMRWKNPHDGGTEGTGRAIVGSDNAGSFYFFDVRNTELVIKALDGSGWNRHLWIFFGALTDLEYWLTVTEVATGVERVYYNPPGEICGQVDLQAFEVPIDGPPDAAP